MTSARNDTPPPASLSIAAVERETGITKDTLRIWERRYGFPQPVRDANDDRLYPLAQVQRLKRIRRLLDAGHRPGKIVHLADVDLQELLDKTNILSKTISTSSDYLDNLEPLLRSIEAHDTQQLRDALQHALMRYGMSRFVHEVVAPLTTAVGEAWAQGRFEIFEEHLYTEVMGNVLRSNLEALRHRGSTTPPKVLLTTVQQELHGLGLLMVEALLTLEGCECVSLGTQTPLDNIVQAAAAYQVNVVALSFTNVHTPVAVQHHLQDLRHALPQTTAIWVGGSCTSLYQKPWKGITALQDLHGLSTLVQQWRTDRVSI